jgi:hypothetical protein
LSELISNVGNATSGRPAILKPLRPSLTSSSSDLSNSVRNAEPKPARPVHEILRSIDVDRPGLQPHLAGGEDAAAAGELVDDHQLARGRRQQQPVERDRSRGRRDLAAFDDVGPQATRLVHGAGGDLAELDLGHRAGGAVGERRLDDRLLGDGDVPAP